MTAFTGGSFTRSPCGLCSGREAPSRSSRAMSSRDPFSRLRHYPENLDGHGRDRSTSHPGVSWPSSRNCATETAGRRSSVSVSPRDPISRLRRTRVRSRPLFYRQTLVYHRGTRGRIGTGSPHGRVGRTFSKTEVRTTRLRSACRLWLLQLHSPLMAFAACGSLIYCNSYHVRWRLQ
jgi:hypothetical protein